MVRRVHWSNIPLVGGPGRHSVTIQVDAAHDEPDVVALAGRLPRLVAALRRPIVEGGDPLEDEPATGVLMLLELASAVRQLMEEQEGRVLLVARGAGYSYTRLAEAIGVRSQDTVRERIRRVHRAKARAERAHDADR